MQKFDNEVTLNLSNYKILEFQVCLMIKLQYIINKFFSDKLTETPFLPIMQILLHLMFSNACMPRRTSKNFSRQTFEFHYSQQL